MKHGLKYHNERCQIIEMSQVMHASGPDAQSKQARLNQSYTKKVMDDQDNQNQTLNMEKHEQSLLEVKPKAC